MSKTLSFRQPERTARVVVSFDATGTLFHCPELYEIYSEVLTRHGSKVSQEEVRRLFAVVFQELDCSTPPGADRFVSHTDGARGWWAWFLRRLCELAGADPPSRFAANELFEIFGRGETWSLYDETIEVLTDLSARGFELVVLSNWDSRLRKILADLDLESIFHRIFLSSEEGLSKPNPELFKHAMRAMRVGPTAWNHIGDDRINDGEGAESVGARGIVIDRARGKDLRYARDEVTRA